MAARTVKNVTSDAIRSTALSNSEARMVIDPVNSHAPTFNRISMIATQMLAMVAWRRSLADVASSTVARGIADHQG